jgi:hypothetical protein
MKNSNVTFKVEQNQKFKDFRVVKYLNGEWLNERDGNWTKKQADKKAKSYTEASNKGLNTMADNY